MDVDTIVVGAGPAGATVAREIRERGHSVLLLDRAGFPRPKPCGGGVSVACAALLPFDISEVVEHVVTGVVFGDPLSGTVTRDAGHTIGFLTERTRFDALLVDHARCAGVAFRDDTPVTSVSRRYDGSYEVQAGDGGATERHHARVVVGADGANGIVRTMLAFGGRVTMGVALEGDLPCPDGIPEWLQGRVAIATGFAPGGYAWLFPKGTHVNVGVGGREGAGPLLRDALSAYMIAHGWEPSALEAVRGHRLPLRSGPLEVVSGGAVTVGDAAGLIDALAGGGIYGAVFSGIMAARAIHEYLDGEVSDLSGYAAALDREFLPRLEHLQRVADVVYAWPSASAWALKRSTVAWGVAARLIADQHGLRGRAVTTALRPAAALGRYQLRRRTASAA